MNYEIAYKIIFNLIGGTWALIYGVEMMSKNLEQCAGKTMKKVLQKLTNTLFKSFIIGIGITALVQSSTAVTVITMSFVSARLMTLKNAVGIIYGTNIGTTITAQLMSFNITSWGMPFIVLGYIISLFSRKKYLNHFSRIILGFGLMLLGIKILNLSALYIHKSSHLYDLFKVFGQNPWWGLLLGIFITMLVQSSSATVGLTIVLFNSHLIGLESAIGLTLGDNIGTCITAQLASLNCSVEGKRTALAHSLYNILGVFIGMIFLSPFSRLVLYTTDLLAQDHTKIIANTHTIFNALSALLFFPFTNLYVSILEWLIPNKSSKYLENLNI